MELRFAAYNGIADTAIKDLIDLVGPVRHRSIVREMIIAALKAGQENPQMADLKIMCGTLKEMRYTSKVFGAYRNAAKSPCSARHGRHRTTRYTGWPGISAANLPPAASW